MGRHCWARHCWRRALPLAAQDIKLPAHADGDRLRHRLVGLQHRRRRRQGDEGQARHRRAGAARRQRRGAPRAAARAAARRPPAMGIGVYFAQEGVFEFAVKDWGPQPLRLILASSDCNAISLGVAKDTGVKEIKDLKGKRVGMVVGSPALNQNAFAVLAFGGLTRSDVKLVEFSSYGAMWKGILNNEVDAAIASTISGPGEGSRGLAARPAVSADARGRQGRLGAHEQDRPVLRAAQGDLRRRHHGAEPGRAAELSLSDLHGLRLAAGRPGLRHHQVDDRRTTPPTRTARRARRAWSSRARTSPGCCRTTKARCARSGKPACGSPSTRRTSRRRSSARRRWPRPGTRS